MQPETTDQLLRKIQDLEAAVARRTEQLLASTGRAYSFLDSINKGFIMCDTSGRLMLANDALRRILAGKSAALGDGSEELTIEVVDQLMRPNLELISLVKQCITSKQTLERDNVNFGQQILRIYITPLLSSGSNSQQDVLGVVVLTEDLTEQKMLERSKDEFLSIASHELRTPLTAIRGNTSIIQKYYVAAITDQEVNEMIADIHESSVRLIGIVNDFLDVAALEQGKIEVKAETFALSEVMEETARELGNLCTSKGINLIVDPSLQSVPDVTADRRRIKQVIINLIGNAIKFTDEGSITLSASSDSSFVRVVVADTGEGMSPESQRLLFHKFQQAGTSLLTRETSKGTGLGLYISKLIIELFGGTIGLEKSELGVGTSFAFTLPRT